MAKTAQELQKALEEALAEAKAAQEELEALKGKKADEAAKSDELVPVATVLPVRPRGPINYPQLTRTNYTLWAMQMRVALQSAGVWSAVSSETVSFEEDRDALLASTGAYRRMRWHRLLARIRQRWHGRPSKL